MQELITQNLDYVVFAVVFVALFVAQRIWLKRAGQHQHALIKGIWLAAVGILLAGLFTLNAVANWIRSDANGRAMAIGAIAMLLLLLGCFSTIIALFRSDRQLRRETSTERAREKQRIELILRLMADGVVVVDREGRVQLLNRVAEELSGWQNADAAGKPVSEVVRLVNDKSRLPFDSPALRSMDLGSYFPPKDGTVILSRANTEQAVAASASPLRDGENKIVGAVMILRDLSAKQLVAAEAEQLQQERLDPVGTLAGGIAHEFNNIFTVVIGNLSLAKMFLEPEDKVYPLVDKSEQESLRAKELTRQLLTFSKGGAPVKKPLAPSVMIQTAVQKCGPDKSPRCKLVLPGDLWAMDVDEGQVGQAMDHLLAHAFEAMPEGGDVVISAENLEIGVDTKLPLSPGRYVKVSVRDHGPGLDPERLKSIFDPFSTLKKSLSGLGLAAVYSIVKRHQGHIEVDSHLGKGTTFLLYLPASAQEAKADAAPAAPAAKPKDDVIEGSGRVLIMDDEEPVRFAISNMLQLIGYEVTETADGAQAVESYRRAKAEGKPFDAVVFDLVVPNGMGGKEAMQKLLELDPKAKAVVSSGYSHDPVMAYHRHYGFTGAIGKPYTLAQLSRVMNEVLKGNPAHS
jgi:PAS domain S-box-containing protein